MTVVQLSIAILLPWALGVTLLRTAWEPSAPGFWPALLGYGYIIGMLITAASIMALGTAGMRLDFLSISLVLMALTCISLILPGRIPVPARSASPPEAPPATLALLSKAAIILLLGLIVFRLGSIALEVAWRPLTPWDAWMNWALKARVWFEYGEFVKFIPPEHWASTPGSTSYTGSTRDNTHYPPLIPLIQLWMALAADEWSETLVNLPWLMCGFALVLAIYGQSRRLAIPVIPALITCYLLVSIPLFGTHIALAGYAELWLAALYALAAMAFAHWTITRCRRQGLLALFLIAALPFVKQPGIAWALTFLPALAVYLMPMRVLLPAVILGLGLLTVVYFTHGISVRLPQLGEISLTQGHVQLPGHESTQIEFFPVWEPLLQNLLIYGNWHLLWYLMPIVLLGAIPTLFRHRDLAPSVALAGTALLFLFVVFFFNERYSREALDFTTLNRALLHAVPALIFIGQILLVRLTRRDLRIPKRMPPIKPISNEIPGINIH